MSDVQRQRQQENPGENGTKKSTSSLPSADPQESPKQRIINHILNQWRVGRNNQGQDWQLTVKVHNCWGKYVKVIFKFNLPPTMVEEFKDREDEIMVELEDKLFEMSDLMKAVRKGSVNEVRQLLRQSVDVNFRNMLGTSALVVLLKPHAFSRCSMSRSGVPCPEQALQGKDRQRNLSPRDKADINILHMLIEAGVDLNVKDHAKCSVLQMAMVAGKIELANILVRAGAPIIEWVRISGRNPTMDNDIPKTHMEFACSDECNDAELVRGLIARGAINRRRAIAAVQYAIKAGNAASVQLLIDAGVNVQTIELNPLSILHKCTPDTCSPICVMSVLYKAGVPLTTLVYGFVDMGTSLTFYNGFSLNDCARRAVYHQIVKSQGLSNQNFPCHSQSYRDAVSQLPIPDLVKKSLLNQYGMEYCSFPLRWQWEHEAELQRISRGLEEYHRAQERFAQEAQSNLLRQRHSVFAGSIPTQPFNSGPPAMPVGSGMGAVPSGSINHGNPVQPLPSHGQGQGSGGQPAGFQ